MKEANAPRKRKNGEHKEASEKVPKSWRESWTESALPNLPDATALASLVSQPRFTKMANTEAIKAALKLLHECQNGIYLDAVRWKSIQKLKDERDEIPKPKEYPAKLEEFYRLIVRAKDKTNSQPRFKKYLADLILGVNEMRRKPLMRVEAEEEAEQRFRKLVDSGFADEDTWVLEVQAYGGWWEGQKKENKRKAGQASRTKREEIKKPKAAETS